MSLATRLKSAQANTANNGCQTCKWWKTISAETQALINEWFDAGNSNMQLHSILTTPSEDVDPSELLTVSYTAWRNHLVHHKDKCR